jgi:hypothetical protein
MDVDFDLPIEDTTEGDEEAHGDGGPGGTCFIFGLGDLDTLEDIHCEILVIVVQ